MLHSKATAALMRLKEMDRKYNLKRNEGKRAQSNVSTESSLEGSPRNLQLKPTILNNKDSSEDGPISPVTVTQKETVSKVFSKSKMEIKIPINQIEGDESSISESLISEKIPKVTSEARSITENNKNTKVEEKSDTSRTKESSKSALSLASISTVKIKDSTSGHDDSSENNNDSSITTILSKRSDVSETVSEAVQSSNESSTKKSNKKYNVQEIIGTENSVPISNSDNNETTIEEVIKISEERSEIVSERSHTTNDGILVENFSSREEQKTRYEDDTFEEASSFVESSSSAEERLKNTSQEDTVVSGVKQIKITPHKQINTTQKVEVNEDRDKEIVELVAPKIMQSTSECDIGLDEELSNYVRTTENVDEAMPISLLKLSKQTTPTRRNAKRSRRHRKSSNENTDGKSDSFVASEHERLTERKENNTNADVMGENGSSTSTRSIESERKEQKETSLPTEQNKVENDNKTKGEKSKIEIVESEVVYSEEKLLRETPKQSDVTSTLRKLNKDAINAIVRKHRVPTPTKASNKQRHCKNCGTIVKLPSASAARNTEDDDSDTSSIGDVKMSKESNQDQKVKQKKTKSKKASRSSKSRKSSNYNKIEGKNSKFDCRQANRLRKHAAAYRMQQEREDIHNYLRGLEHTRLEFGSGESSASFQLSAFKPLEFPRIATFVKPDLEDIKFKVKDEVVGLQERILIIRQWLKDQYILYRDYSSLAQTVNSKYIPASLEDAKKTIRQLQRVTIKSR